MKFGGEDGGRGGPYSGSCSGSAGSMQKIGRPKGAPPTGPGSPAPTPIGQRQPAAEPVPAGAAYEILHPKLDRGLMRSQCQRWDDFPTHILNKVLYNNILHSVSS